MGKCRKVLFSGDGIALLRTEAVVVAYTRWEGQHSIKEGEGLMRLHPSLRRYRLLMFSGSHISQWARHG